MDVTHSELPNAKTSAQSELLLSLGLLGILVVLIIPLPTVLLDTFLATNLSVSIVILLITLNIRQPLEISVFPSLLLLLTLGRLSLNVATTRLILLQGDAGKIVSTFGGLVVGGNIVVGLVIFLILIVIQFIVITKGASRISEVAARFTLDALPGKQMAIDAELGSGNIDEETAKQRRESLNLETEFYGSMDGAGKFVRGDAIAGLVITAINLIGGIVIGMMNGMSVTDAIHTYSTLTIGDGLISQIPGLIIATTAGILVTKATSSTSLGSEIGNQVTRHSRPLIAGAVILAALALVPGLPKIPFFLLSASLVYLWRRQVTTTEVANDADAPAPESSDPFEQHFQEFLQIDAACLEIGVNLVGMVDSGNERGLIQRVSELRADLARKHGIWVPAVRVRDNIRIDPNSYRIIINGREESQGVLEPGQMFAIDPGTSTGSVEGRETKDPAFGLPAKWIESGLTSRASRMGYTVVDASTVLITHLGEVLRKSAADLLSREDLGKLLDELRKTSPTLINEIKPETIRISDIHQVLKRLLAERVPICNFVRILEAILQHANTVKDPTLLAEHVRAALGNEILDPFRDKDGVVHAIVCEPSLESKFRDSVNEGFLAIDPKSLEKLASRLNELRQRSLAEDKEAVLLVDSSVRQPIRNAIERALPDQVVVGYSEVPRDVQIEFKSILKTEEVFSNDDMSRDQHAELHGAA